ncbi:MAG: Hsp20/alpha crystallin family protein [Thermodesulfovibrionales bacterium]|nr:Hsp20/alpha crystallin family protein [Thermodesulfovibrionales bacterium]
MKRSLFLYEVKAYKEPLIDLYETDEELIFKIDLPGIDVDNISIKVYEDLLIIEGLWLAQNVESPTKIHTFLCVERNIKTARRVIKIPIPVNTVAGKAFYENGVVTIKFPKLKDKLIKIKIEQKG